MGIFSKLFGDSDQTDLRSKLYEEYVGSFMSVGWSQQQAREVIRDMLLRAEQRSREQKTDKYPRNFGDTLVANQHSDAQAKAIVERLHAEGVRDEDIRWWWNLHDLERCMMAENDDLSRFTLFRKERQEGASTDEAKLKVVKHFPIFGVSPDDEAPTPDSPLPSELKDRINRYVASPEGGEHLRTKSPGFSSMNAYVRERIRDGSI